MCSLAKPGIAYSSWFFFLPVQNFAFVFDELNVVSLSPVFHSCQILLSICTVFYGVSNSSQFSAIWKFKGSFYPFILHNW